MVEPYFIFNPNFYLHYYVFDNQIQIVLVLIYIFFSVLSYMVVILIFFSLFWSTFCQKYSVHGHLKNYIWAVSMFDSIYLTRCILHWLHFIVIVLWYWYMYIILCYAFEYKVQILSKTLIDVYAKAKEYLFIIICK